LDDGGELGGTAPAAGDSLVFDGSTRPISTNNFAANTTFSNITFNIGAGAFTLKGNAFALAGEIVNNSASLQTLSLGLTSSSTCSVNIASGDITVSGVITGACMLYKRGDAKLTLSGNNSYSVGTTIGGGTLVDARLRLRVCCNEPVSGP
jgi:autotransporter-associated beta strand protein